MSDETLIPWLEIDEIYDFFGYINRRAALRAIRNGSFPVPTYIVSGRLRVVDREVFFTFFRLNRQAGLEHLELEAGAY